MSITPSILTRASAVALVAAGVIFIVIQPLHPREDVASIATSTWFVVHLLSLTMAVLALAGITGVYLVFSLFFLTQAAVGFVESFILPLSAAGSPELTEDVASLFVGGYVLQTDVGPLAIVGSVGAVLYLGGGILFGIAVILGRALPRWTGVLLMVAALASLSAVVLPHDLARYAAVPMGIALVALGVTLIARRNVK
jgi:hypothetical protein